MNKRILFNFVLIIGLLSSSKTFGSPIIEKDSIKPKKRLALVYTTGGIAYAGSLYFLNNLWYSDYPKSNFHFFNDNAEWLQMDKLGHATTAYHVSLWGMDVMHWAGLNKKKATWVGGLAGPLYLTTIEILDGFSAGWGASPGDLIANTFGSVLSIGQQLQWDEQRVALKWSYHNTKYPKYRPDLFGRNISEWMLKDYNGQTYWLSCNIKSLSGIDGVPRWLNVAFGYSADGMTGAFENFSNYKDMEIPSFKRSREFIFSFDVDLKKIKTKSKLIKSVSNVFGFLKFPSPALLYSDKRFKIYPLYF